MWAESQVPRSSQHQTTRMTHAMAEGLSSLQASSNVRALNKQRVAWRTLQRRVRPVLGQGLSGAQGHRIQPDGSRAIEHISHPPHARLSISAKHRETQTRSIPAAICRGCATGVCCRLECLQPHLVAVATGDQCTAASSSPGTRAYLHDFWRSMDYRACACTSKVCSSASVRRKVLAATPAGMRSVLYSRTCSIGTQT